MSLKEIETFLQNIINFFGENPIYIIILIIFLLALHKIYTLIKVLLSGKDKEKKDIED